MYNMEILPPGLSHYSRVPPIHPKIPRDVLPQLPKYKRAPGEVQRCEVPVRNGLRDNLGGRPRDELNDAWGNTGFGEDLMDDVVGVCCGRRGFPDYDIAY